MNFLLRTLAAVVILISALTLQPQAVSASIAQNPQQSSFYPDSPIVNVLNAGGRSFVLTQHGSVYAPSGGYLGGAHVPAGSVATKLYLCLNGPAVPVGYIVIDSHQVAYYFGTAYGCGGSWGYLHTKSQPVFSVDSTITWTTGGGANNWNWILTISGSVYAPDGYYFGNAYIPWGLGDADRLNVCYHSGYPVGYTVLGTYGTTSRLGTTC